MTSNSEILNTYDRNIAKFIERTPKDTIGETKIWLDTLTEKVTPKSAIFEVGSGFGRDAMYMKSKGLNILCSDGAPGFVGALADSGLDARQFNVLTDEFTDQYDLIFADAVFEHFTPEELTVVISKIHQATKERGTLGCSVRRGDGEYWSDEKLDEKRYFRLWQPAGLTELLSSAGYTVDSIAESTGYQNIERLYVIATK